MAADFGPVTLRLFVAVCEEDNIARAAERAAIVASAVSKRIAAIEAQTGAPLLVRGCRGIAPTAAGQTLLRQARQVLGLMARMHAELSDFASGVQAACGWWPARRCWLNTWPATLVASCASTLPCARAWMNGSAWEIVRAVREGTADLGVLWDATSLQGLAHVPYRSDQLCQATPAGHRWARRKRISFARALDELSVCVAPGGMMDVMLKREAALLGRAPALRTRVSGTEAAARMVAAGLGPAVLPRQAITGHISSAALALVPLTDAWARRQFRVCTRGDGSVTAAARLLMGYLGRQAEGAGGLMATASFSKRHRCRDRCTKLATLMPLQAATDRQVQTLAEQLSHGLRSLRSRVLARLLPG